MAGGADRIKLLVSGIINFKEGRVTTPPQMVVEEVRALVEAARSHGKQTFAHASGADGVMLKEGSADLSAYGEVVSADDEKVTLRVSRADAPAVTTRLLRDLPVADLTIEDPPIEDVIELVFAEGAG